MTYVQTIVVPVEHRGSSSIKGTAILCSQLPELFARHNIKKLFDAGANDCAWQYSSLANMVEYSAGEHNPIIIAIAQRNYPDLNIQLHNIIHNDIPLVDCLFVRDVAIHLNNTDKRNMLVNWLRSGTPWLLITQQCDIAENLDFEYVTGKFPFADLNWQLEPWSFPKPIDQVADVEFLHDDKPPERFMYLWHRDQLRDLV